MIKKIEETYNVLINHFDFLEYLYSSYLTFFLPQKKNLVKICWLLIMNPTFVTCHTWARRQGNDILTTSATMCKIKSHNFCTFGSMLLNKFKEDSKGLHKKKNHNLSQSCICCANKVDVRIWRYEASFLFLKCPHPI
jgi:hypothetical protein